MEEVIGLLNCHLQLLFATEHNVLLLHVGREAVGDEVCICIGFRLCLVPPCQPAVETAADGTVCDVDNIAGRSEHNTLAACIGASPLGDDARYGAHIGLNLRDGFRVIDDDGLVALFCNLGRVFLNQFLLTWEGSGNWVFDSM